MPKKNSKGGIYRIKANGLRIYKKGLVSVEEFIFVGQPPGTIGIDISN